ncbi:MAG: hypothetical protein CVV18_04215 [Gammaproteobacteria bacterium HGW-Gammaproteobacteria-8]|nr:MAG: hypothetical protein CVV18_04215 [Gammaproteobacteria bacterium HGW-Gammaproteobacteria-8]
MQFFKTVFLVLALLALDAQAQSAPVEGDCQAAANWPGREPAWFASACLNPMPSDAGTVEGMPIGSAEAYMLSFGIFSGPDLTGTVTYPMPDILSPTNLAASIPALYSADFDQNSGVLYAVDNDTFSIGTVDLNTGVYTQNGSITGTITGTVTGLAWDPTDGSWYLTVGNTLYSVDPDTGVASLIGDTGLTTLIEIKFDASGQLYATDIDDDSLYAIDKTNAGATLIGALGFNLSFAQGMAYDYTTDTMWGWLYQGGGLVDWATIDLTSGTATSVVNFVNDGPEASGAILGGGGGTPPPETQPVPILSNLGLILLSLMLAGLALVAIRVR